MVSRPRSGGPGSDWRKVIGGESSEPDDTAIPEYSVSTRSAKELTERMEEFVVGQRPAKRILSHAVAMHLWKIAATDSMVESPNVLLLGPTGCGKTLTASTLADVCGVPFVPCESASLVPSGIVGFKLEHIAELLWQGAEDILNHGGFRARDDDVRGLAERGIVFLDEFDKLSDKDVVDGDSQRARVQRNLLRFVEGMTIHVGETQNYTYRGRDGIRTLNSGRVLFVAAGAFAGISELRTQRVENNLYKQMFGASERVVPEDIKNYGFLPELIGRFEVVGEFSELTIDELAEILASSPRSPLPSLVGYARTCGVELQFADDALRTVASHAAALGLGARGLQQLLFPLVTDRLDKAAASHEDRVVIDRGDFERPSDLW